MGNIDGLKEKVEELKQRFSQSQVEVGPEVAELKSRLASIKANLEGKRQEISRLAAEKERLAADLERLTAENDQLRKMLGEVLAVIDDRSSSDATMILREFLAETDPLIQTAGIQMAGDGGGEARAAAQAPGGAAPVAADPAHDDGPEQGARSSGGEGRRDEDASETESPALRRILKRGHRAG